MNWKSVFYTFFCTKREEQWPDMFSALDFVLRDADITFYLYKNVLKT